MACKGTFLLLVVCLAAVGRCCGQEAAERAPSEEADSWTGWALNKLSEGIGLVDSDEPKNVAGNVVQKTSDAASDTSEKAKDAAGYAKDKAQQAYDSASGMAGGATQGVKDEASKAANAAGDAGKKMEDAMRQGKDKASETYDGAKSKLHDAYAAAKNSMSDEEKRNFEEAERAGTEAGNKIRGG